MRPIQDLNDVIRNLLKDISKKYNIPLHELYSEYGVTHGDRKPLPYKKPSPVVLKPVPFARPPTSPIPNIQDAEAASSTVTPHDGVGGPTYDQQQNISQEKLNSFFGKTK